MSAVNREQVNLVSYQFFGPFQVISGCPDRRTDAQATVRVFGRVGIFQFLLDVLNSDETF